MTQSVIENLLAGLAATLLIYLVSRVWRRVRKHLAHSAVSPSASPVIEEAAASARLPLPLPDGLSIPEKVTFLERQREEAVANGVAARSRGENDSASSELEARVIEGLRTMAFLRAGDVLDDRYRLLVFVGAGRISVVWKAYDLLQDHFVAVKFLRYMFVNDQSLVGQFHYTARLMSEFSSLSIAAVRQGVKECFVDGGRKLVYYVLEHVEGEPLDVYAARRPGQQAAIVDALLEVGRCLVDAHANGVVHRDLKPGNILVQPSGALKLVDFDSVLRLGDRRIFHNDLGTFGYSAPEVLNGAEDPDVRADIFALGRVFSYLYYGRRLPNAYELSVYDLIDLLNCAPVLKDTLERATAVSPVQRYGSMKEFLAELQAAIAEDRGQALPPVETLKRERDKVSRLLQHSFYGTFVAMIVARPIFAHLGLTHLSDRAWVGAFHAIIGSLVWGTFISGAFILYLVLFARRLRSRPASYSVAAACCAIGGLLGGVLVSVPSVFVTNSHTLACLGWLTDPADLTRLDTALFGTRMMLTYPLGGLLTGLGVGLCLYHGIEIALARNPQGSGILPVPSKRSFRDRAAGPSVVGPLLTSLQGHASLALPAILSFLVVLVLNASEPAPTYGCTIAPNEQWRSLGEGIVHYIGAIGLTMGFFLGVRGSDPTQK